MNWLAHFWLADRSHTSAAGQLLGDRLKGRIDSLPGLDVDLREGIRLHRRIDSQADAHPVHGALRECFDGDLRRYAGIIVDIGLDHALARRWDDWHEESLEAFAERMSHQMAAEWPNARRHGTPPNPTEFASLLAGYREPSGMARALHHVETRLRRRVDLSRGVALVQAHRDRFERGIAPLLDHLLDVIERA